MNPPRIAVVGSGIAGLAVAHGLSGSAQVTLFEAGGHFGGHTHTVDLTLDGVTHGVDTGFLVLNERTYPNLLRLLASLGIDTAPAEMSFSVQTPAGGGTEWSGNNLDSVFAQRRNLLRLGFWRMLADIVRFNRIATALAESGDAAALDTDLDAFLDLHRFSSDFREGYFLPMIGSIWSCPVDQMLRFPVATMIRFCHNHGLLQISDRPQWHTVPGGARRYVQAMLRDIPDARLATPVRRIERPAEGGGSSDDDSGSAAGARGNIIIRTDAGNERFDEVVLACHSDQALALLATPSADETAVLSAIRYHANRAVLHTDSRLLPSRRRAWAAWNYERAADTDRERAAVCLHYLLNRLQPLPFGQPVIVSLNPVRQPRADSVHAEFDYAHPVFDRAAIAAQARIPALQGRRHTWFCGAWTGHGFHEDGLVSGLGVCAGISRQLAGAAHTAEAAV